MSAGLSTAAMIRAARTSFSLASALGLSGRIMYYCSRCGHWRLVSNLTVSLCIVTSRAYQVLPMLITLMPSCLVFQLYGSMWTCKFLDPRWHWAASSISTSLLVALKMAGRLEGAMMNVLSVFVVSKRFCFSFTRSPSVCDVVHMPRFHELGLGSRYSPFSAISDTYSHCFDAPMISNQALNIKFYNHGSSIGPLFCSTDTQWCVPITSCSGPTNNIEQHHVKPLSSAPLAHLKPNQPHLQSLKDVDVKIHTP